MTSGDLAKDVLEAEEQLEMHQERKAEIDGRHEYYLSLRQRGEALVEQKHHASQEIQVRKLEGRAGFRLKGHLNGIIPRLNLSDWEIMFLPQCQ